MNNLYPNNCTLSGEIERNMENDQSIPSPNLSGFHRGSFVQEQNFHLRLTMFLFLGKSAHVLIKCVLKEYIYCCDKNKLLSYLKIIIVSPKYHSQVTNLQSALCRCFPLFP